MKRLHPDILFESTNLSENLLKKSVRGGTSTVGTQGLQFILKMMGTMVLARLLTPSDFGLIAMVTVIINFAQMFKEAGLSMATIQKDKINREQISTLFWINSLISLSLGLCVLVSSPIVALFYGKPELTSVTAVLSITFILSGLSIQHSALLHRHMCFGSIAIIRISTQIISLVVMIILAYYGMRYWAIVAGTIASTVSSLFITFFFCPWVPDWIQKGSGIRDMLRFGGHLTIFNFVNYFSRNADNILIGRFVGIDALGLYTKAYQIVYLPLTNIRQPINTVAIPILSSLKNDPERFQRYYGKIVFLMAFFSMPLMAFCVVFPKELILLVFGSQWLPMTEIFRILAMAGFIQPVTGTRGALLVACGQSKLYLTLGAITAFLTVTGFCIGLNWGAYGVAASFVIVVYIIQYPMFKLCFRYVPGTFKGVLANCWHIAMLSWVSCLCAKSLAKLIPSTGNLSLVWGGLAMMVIFLVMAISIPFTNKSLQESIQILKRGLS